MHNRFFCTGVELFFCLGLAQPSGHSDWCYKNTPVLGVKQEPLWRFLQTAHLEWAEESLV